ncbi:MBL fold metallo-hydrolase [Flavobacterium sp. Sd200]|uniref:MBL fold metallo-hydrolase n=1 Tax=Flavobacterium sp. Sd200 TaxID=2692211 RepID=UPI00137142DF|nr:MBL fold metallo-hydrolase [Flavobacterium sp. Sd200]MXN90798.1 MBL fold metallo-hydrolase [Flavobacterium sp. Sd200]
MKPNKIILALVILLSGFSAHAQFPMPDQVPIWDANTVTLTLHKISDNVYAVSPSTVEKETTQGIPQATSAGFIVGEKGVLLIETMLNKRLYNQLYALVRSVTKKPILYAVNTSDHGDHCFGNYLLPQETVLIQNEFCKENLSKNYENIKKFMISLFGKGRGIEESIYRPADITIAVNQSLKLDLGAGNIVEFINVGTAQSPADLFVYLRSPYKNVLWAGNPVIAESPAIPWLFDGYFLEPVSNFTKIYNMIGDNDVVVPGHGRITNKAGMKFTMDYLTALKENVENAVKSGKTLEQTKAQVTMKEFNKGYALFNWLHFNFNIPNAYKDIKANTP